jgi:ASC-1-like (ASCH) protein
MKIYKKVQHEYFEAILDGRKQFEIRLADFKYKPGDTLVLQEQKPSKKTLSGRELPCEILFNINTKTTEKFWPKEKIDKYGLVVLSIRRKFKFKINNFKSHR